MKRFKTVLAFLIVLSSSLSMPIYADPEMPADANTCYPLDVGNVWTYQFGENNGTGRYEVTGYSEKYSAYLIKYTMKTIDVNIETESLIGIKGDSILRIGGTDIKSGKARLIYDRPEVILKSPLKVGMTWGYEKDNRDNNLTCKVKCKVIKITGCNVIAGHFENVYMVLRETYYIDKNKREKYRDVHNEYYAPHVGLIKEEIVEDARNPVGAGRKNKNDKPIVLMELSEYKIK